MGRPSGRGAPVACGPRQAGAGWRDGASYMTPLGTESNNDLRLFSSCACVAEKSEPKSSVKNSLELSTDVDLR